MDENEEAARKCHNMTMSSPKRMLKGLVVISREYANGTISSPQIFMNALAHMDVDDVATCESRADKHVANMQDKM